MKTAGPNSEQLQMATASMPAALAANLCIQIMMFQDSIAHKEDGNIATIKEINVLCKLINCLYKLKKYISLPMAIQSIMGFMHYVNEQDAKLGAAFAVQFDNYMAREGNKAFQPHELEYDAPAITDIIERKEAPVKSTPPLSEKKTNEPAPVAAKPVQYAATPAYNKQPTKHFSHSGLNKQSASFANRASHLAATG